MPEISTYIGEVARTVNNITGSKIGRGLRVVYGSDGNVTLAPIGVRGDFITMHDIETAEAGMAHPMQAGSKMSAVASEATNMGDLAYSAANGQVSKTSAGAILLGRWAQPASGAGALSEVELFNPA